MAETNERPNPAGISEQEVQDQISKMDLPSNSNKDRRLKKVVKGTVKEHKKGLGDKFRETFLAEDVADVKNYIFFDVIVPAVKDTIVNVIVNGINAVVYGDTRPKNSRFNAPYSSNRTSYGSGYTSYSSMSRNRPPEGNFRPSHGYSRKEPITETKYDAELVLEELNGCLYEYDQVTVGDLYDLLGFDSEHTDYKWGWVDLSTATVRKVPEGWLIDLPRPSRL